MCHILLPLYLLLTVVLVLRARGVLPRVPALMLAVCVFLDCGWALFGNRDAKGQKQKCGVQSNTKDQNPARSSLTSVVMGEPSDDDLQLRVIGKVVTGSGKAARRRSG